MHLYEWVLILTLSTAGTTYEGKAIHSIDFKSEKSCVTAGKSWLSQLDKQDQKLASYVCVKRGN